ncbi:uncharacterized protein LOC129767938 [Toxorhynchites rutilus septentrionalis]|uniref:uncharacterized protein LOC129767938 n=1 Tax=Toxorhynchites rutilus septentrionalis TaxID=329112 RepID=UPI00247AD07F|nr:uncharacterized protein LOC129767938 [Toxorhynchites rutilus septentrionalis]
MSTRPKRAASDGNSFTMWVSTNKVLIGSVGGPKRPHSRNPNFDCEETKLLISLWGDPTVQKTLVTTHKKHPVIAKLATKMREYGYNRSTEEINTRIKNLKCFYNRIKKDLETNVINETSWKHFQAMDEIMTRPIFGNSLQQLPNSDSQAGPSSGKSQICDQVDVKLEILTDEDKEIRTEELLKNAEQVELKEPNLLIPKDEPMEQDNDDDPNDPDFENDGDDEEDSPSDDSDESDFDIDDERRRARLRRRASRKSTKANTKKNVKAPVVITTVSSTATSSTPAPTVAQAPTQSQSTIKIINYTGKPGLNISTIVPNSNINASLSGQNMAIVSATPTVTTSSTAGKISLVPTNFLLKPQAPKISFNSPIQLYTKPTVSIASSMPTTMTVSSASAVQPMKLLFVNTGGGQKQQIITPATKQIYTTATPIVKTTPATQIAIQPKPVVTPTTSLMTVTQNKPDPTPVHSNAPVAPKQAGFKALLGQLVTLQRDNLAISRNRLSVERERFNNEKQIVCSLVEALNDLNNMLQKYSSTVSVSDDVGFGSSQQFQFSNDIVKESRMNDISQDIPLVSNLIPVIDTIKAEVISDSD